MSVAERTRALPAEPDRLAQFSAPREVERLYGHAAALGEFTEALASGRMHHAWLLVGPEGVGKATLAYRFARIVLALGSGDEGEAGAKVFRKVAALSHPNLLLIRRSYNDKTKRYSQWIGVDEVRRLRAFLGHSAGEAGWRVVIVDRADEMNQNAANALLKTLEEPPAQTLFLLIASAEGRLPITIRSRARTLRVSGLGRVDLAEAVRAALARDGYEADPGALDMALALAQGSVRRALELLTGEGIDSYRDIAAMLGNLPDLDGAALHGIADRLSGMGDTERIELYFALLLGLIERLIRFAATGDGALKEEQAIAARLISPANLDRWAEAWEAIAEAKDEALAYNLDRGLLLLETWFRLQKLAREHPV